MGPAMTAVRMIFRRIVTHAETVYLVGALIPERSANLVGAYRV